MWVSSSVLVLILATTGLLVMAYVQTREIFWGGRDWQRELRRYRRAFLRRFPQREQLSKRVRLLDALQRFQRDRASWHVAVEELTDGHEAFENRVRDEIDRIAGKEVYHGQKEQL